MNIKRLAPLAAAAALALFGSAAHATVTNTYKIGVLDPAGWTKSLSISGDGTSFSDIIDFKIASPDTFAIGVVDNVSALPYFGISGLTGTLYTGFGGTGSQVGSELLGSGTLSGILAPGKYSLVLAGTTTGTLGGDLLVSAQAVAPVPEPAEGALMGAGLGLVGLVSRRKKNKAAAIAA